MIQGVIPSIESPHDSSRGPTNHRDVILNSKKFSCSGLGLGGVCGFGLPLREKDKK